jgi:sulfate adenylyltransferase subunit 2
MLYSIGKDSSVMLHLTLKAFYPSPPPFLLHVDTTWKFRAMYDFRDPVASDHGLQLIVHETLSASPQGISPFTHGSAMHTDMWKTEDLKPEAAAEMVIARLCEMGVLATHLASNGK